MKPFDILDALPVGPHAPRVLAVEASAGTGKTWSIASLVTRLVAETGAPIDSFLVLTFTRAAAAELRERIRGRLAEALRTVETGWRPAPGPGEPPDPVLDHLLEDPEARATRIERLRTARERFDLCEVGTIHSFAQRVLARATVDAGLPSRDLEMDLDARVEELVADYHASVLAPLPEDVWEARRKLGGITPKLLRSIASLVIANPTAALTPSVPSVKDADLAAWRAALRDFARAFLPGIDALEEAIRTAHGARLLSGVRYKPNTIRKNLDLLAAFLIDPQVHRDETATWYRYLSRENAGTAFTHPMIDAWERVLEAARPLADASASIRADFADWVRAQWPRVLERERIRSTDGLLRDLLAALDDDATGPALCDDLRRRYRYVLVDEFQDTDDVQWDVFRAAFARRPEGSGAMWLIGDPKQAIYAFRGANLPVYLEARDTSADPRTMTVNHRSDAELLARLNGLLDEPGSLGMERCPYVPVTAPPHRKPRDLVSADAPPPMRGAPLHVVWFDSRVVAPSEPATTLAKRPSEAILVAQVAEDVARTLGSDLCVHGRAVAPDDIAVLVRTNRQAQAVLAALRARRVPAVIGRSASVLESEEVGWIAAWLEAVASPLDHRALRTLALTPLFGWTAAQVRAATPEDAQAWSRWCATASRWSETHTRKGFAHAFQDALETCGCAQRLLALPRGDRHLVNVRHLAELVHASTGGRPAGPSALLEWLDRTIERPGDLEDAVKLRIASDVKAVTIATIHGSKGLEYGICFVPFAWQKDPDTLRTPALARDGRTTEILLETASETAKQRAKEQTHRESLRLFYVALTRAKHHCAVYTGLGDGYASSPAAYVFHGRGTADPGERANIVARRCGGKSVDGDALLADLRALEPWLTVSVLSGPPGQTRWVAPASPHSDRAVGLAPASIRSAWRRTSYSGLIKGDVSAEEAYVPDGADHDTQPGPSATEVTEATVLPDAYSASDTPVPLDTLRGGKELGTQVHKLLETLDFTRFADTNGSEDGALEAAMIHVAEAARPALATGLPLALRTPLGGPARTADGRELRLADLRRNERLDELRFDLPVRGGSYWARGAATLRARDIADAMALHPDISGAYVERVAGLGFRDFAGCLNGAIDLTFRARTVGHDGDDALGWYVADYKTNRVDPSRTGRCTDANFAPPRLADEMAHAHYTLQALLYLVAVRRYLHARGLGAQPVVGAYYLFLRGMRGPDTPRYGNAVGGAHFLPAHPPTLDALDRALRGDAP
jgi:exodeoxyribonuclease V beta subunit